MSEQNKENEEQGTSAIKRWLGELHHHLLLACVLTLLSGAAAYVINEYFPGWRYAKLVTNPLVGAGALLFILASTSYIGQFLNFLSRRFSKVSRGSGLADVLPLTPGKAQRYWGGCAARIKEAKPERLRLLVFSGASTFGRPGTPLYWVLKKYEKDLQILIALPGSHAFERVINMISDRNSSKLELRQRYLDQHHDAKAFCINLAEQRVPDLLRSIEVRGYEGPVIWKMVSFHNYLWLQHYCHPRSVDETPAYIFLEPSNSSLIIPFESTFDCCWNSATLLLKRDSDKPTINNWDKPVAPGQLG